MARTLHTAPFVLALAVVTLIATPAWSQERDADSGQVPVYLLARAALDAASDDAAAGPATHELAHPASGPLDEAVQWPNPTFHVDVVSSAKRPMTLPLLYGTLVALQAADFYTTSKGMALGARETNPLVRNGTSGTTLALKAASTATTIFIAEKMWKKNKAGAIALMLATNVVYGAVVANNARVIGELR